MLRKNDLIEVCVDREEDKAIVQKFRVTSVDEKNGRYIIQFVDIDVVDPKWDPFSDGREVSEEAERC